MDFENSMNNRDISSFNLEHNNLTNTYWFFSRVGQKEKISSMECRLHGTTVTIFKFKIYQVMFKAYVSHLNTTTMGLSLPVTTIRPFHIIRADETIMPKLNTW